MATTGRRTAVAVAALLLAACTNAPVAEPPTPTATPTPAATEDPGPAPPASVGEVTAVGSADGPCPPGSTCEAVTVTCPDAPEPATAVLATATADDAAGVVVLFSGELGDRWWAMGRGQGPVGGFLDELQRQHTVVQVRWVDGWSVAPAGEEVGPRAFGCRPATVLWHLADELAGLDATGPCRPLCATGNSGGASQIAYAMADHDVGEVLDTVVLSSGPPHAALAAGCADEGEGEARRYEPGAAGSIDAAYGHPEGAGPCAQGDVAFLQTWERDTVGPVEAMPERLFVLLGGADRTSAPSHARAWASALEAAPNVDVVEVDAMKHNVQQSPEGLQTLAELLLQGRTATATGAGSGRPG